MSSIDYYCKPIPRFFFISQKSPKETYIQVIAEELCNYTNLVYKKWYMGLIGAHWGLIVWLTRAQTFLRAKMRFVLKNPHKGSLMLTLKKADVNWCTKMI